MAKPSIESIQSDCATVADDMATANSNLQAVDPTGPECTAAGVALTGIQTLIGQLETLEQALGNLKMAAEQKEMDLQQWISVNCE